MKMDVKRFGELVDAIKEQAKDLQHEDSYIKFLCKEYFECKNEFEDERENLLRWLMGEPCEFYHSKLNREISIMIDDDYETMYIFLVIVQLITWGKQVSDNGTAFLDSLIRRAVAEQRGDEEYVDDLLDDFDEDDDYPDDDDEEIYRVQTGLFRNKENADAMANKLRSMGYPVTIEMFNDLYAVKVGEYDDLEDATELEQKLRRMGYDTLLVSR